RTAISTPAPVAIVSMGGGPSQLVGGGWAMVWGELGAVRVEFCVVGGDPEEGAFRVVVDDQGGAACGEGFLTGLPYLDERGGSVSGGDFGLAEVPVDAAGADDADPADEVVAGGFLV